MRQGILGTDVGVDRHQLAGYNTGRADAITGVTGGQMSQAVWQVVVSLVLKMVRYLAGNLLAENEAGVHGDGEGASQTQVQTQVRNRPQRYIDTLAARQQSLRSCHRDSVVHRLAQLAQLIMSLNSCCWSIDDLLALPNR